MLSCGILHDVWPSFCFDGSVACWVSAPSKRSPRRRLLLALAEGQARRRELRDRAVCSRAAKRVVSSAWPGGTSSDAGLRGSCAGGVRLCSSGDRRSLFGRGAALFAV